MNNKELQIELNEEMIKVVTILKLRKHLNLVGNDDLKKKLHDFTVAYGLSEFIKEMSTIAFRMILNEITEMKRDDEVKVLFNETINISCDKGCIEKTCDVILLGKKSIEVINILPLEIDFVYAFENLEIKLLGLGIIDKYSSQIDGNILRLTIVQPNLRICSEYEIDVIRFLHQLYL